MFLNINTSRICITYKRICSHLLERKLPNYVCAAANDSSFNNIFRFKAHNHYVRIEIG